MESDEPDLFRAAPHAVPVPVASNLPVPAPARRRLRWRRVVIALLALLIAGVLSGSNTPLESMPPWLATIMRASPSTHFVSFAQSILYRGAGIDVVWPEFFATALIGSLFFALALWRFRSVTAQAT